MECTLATLIACFSWSNFYIGSGLQYQDRGDVFMAQYELAVVDQQGNEIPSLRQTAREYTDNPDNLYAKLSLGYEIAVDLDDFGTLFLGLSGSHTSSIETGTDKGVNAACLCARWHPFR